MDFRDETEKELLKDPILECVKILAGRDKDHARLRNGEGFNKRDSEIGNSIASLDGLRLNQFERARKLVRKYEEQLPSKLFLEALDAEWENYYRGNEDPKTTLKGEEKEIDGIGFMVPITVNKKGEAVYDFYQLAKELKRVHNFVYLKDRKNKAISLAYYNPKEGVYGKDGEDRLRFILEHSLGNSAPINTKNEVIQHLKDQGFEYLDNWQNNSNPHIAVRNGVINLEKFVNGDAKGCLELPSPDHHLFSKLDVDYDPDCPQDLLTNHLELVIPDSSDRDRFQKFIGSFLETNGYGHQKIVILYGSPGSGKTVTLRMFAKFFGIENITAKSFQQLTEDRFAMADLFGILANIIEELPQDAIKYLQRLNSLTGGLVDGQKKGRDPFTFYQNAKICAACNDLPEVSSNTETILAFMSRLIIIVFRTAIRGTDKEVQNYDDVLLSQKSGILNWILTGYKNYILAGKKISNSKSTEDTFDYYISNSDFLQYFADGCFVKGDPFTDYIIKEDLWQAYIKAAKIRDVPTQSRQTVLERFPTKTKYVIHDDRMTVGKKANGKPDQRHVFKGIKLKAETEWFKKQDDENNGSDENSSKQQGYGFQDGNLGNDGNQLPDLPTLDTYQGGVNTTRSGSSIDNLPDLSTQNLHASSRENFNEIDKKTMEALQSNGLTVNQELSRFDPETNELSIMISEPSEIMKNLGFEYVNWSKTFGALYKKKLEGGP